MAKSTSPASQELFMARLLRTVSAIETGSHSSTASAVRPRGHHSAILGSLLVLITAIIPKLVGYPIFDQYAI
jgi:hypothetical protein